MVYRSHWSGFLPLDHVAHSSMSRNELVWRIERSLPFMGRENRWSHRRQPLLSSQDFLYRVKVAI